MATLLAGPSPSCKGASMDGGGPFEGPFWCACWYAFWSCGPLLRHMWPALEVAVRVCGQYWGVFVWLVARGLNVPGDGAGYKNEQAAYFSAV